MKGAVALPVIGQYFASTMVIVGMSVVATVIVLHFHHHNPNNGQMPRWVSLIYILLIVYFYIFPTLQDGGRSRHQTYLC